MACCHASVDREKRSVRPYSQRKWLCKKSNISSLYLSSLYLIICMPFSFLASFVFISPACDKLRPCQWDSYPLPSCHKPQTARMSLQCTGHSTEQALHTVSLCTSKKGARLSWFNFLFVDLILTSHQFTDVLMFPCLAFSVFWFLCIDMLSFGNA